MLYFIALGKGFKTLRVPDAQDVANSFGALTIAAIIFRVSICSPIFHSGYFEIFSVVMGLICLLSINLLVNKYQSKYLSLLTVKWYHYVVSFGLTIVIIYSIFFALL